MGSRVASHRIGVLLLQLALALGCGGASAPEPTASNPTPPVTPPPPVPAPPDVPPGPFSLGVPVTDPDSYVEYTPGNMPLLVIAPHGGALQPTTLLARNCTVITATIPGSDCATVNDGGTQELARLVVDSVLARTGRRPHLLVNLLHRNRFDGNRDRAEATGNNAALDRTWTWFHAFADSAKARIVATTPRGLVLDLHGHGHPFARIEWGYLVGRTALNAADSVLALQATNSSLRRLATDSRTGDAFPALVRGPNSLGALVQELGYAGVPSPAQPSPGTEDYFNGGYNTSRHGSRGGSAVDAIQLEAQGPGIRDTPENRARFAGALASALETFLRRHYGWSP
jgi:hypothetical protein